MPKIRLLILLTLPEATREQYRRGIQEKYPDIEINVVDHHSKVAPYMAEADVLVTFGPMMTDRVLQGAKKLKWIQALGTGVDNLIDLPSLGDHVILTNLHGIHGAPVSEAALAAMLALSRDIPRLVRNQDNHTWERWPARLLHEKTVGILGVGSISEALAPRCKAFGMQVIGFSSTPREVPGFDRMVARERMLEVIPELDYFVLLTPHTAATRGMVSASVLAAMKPDSYLINLARAGVVDETALLAALKRGALAGAALDVFNQEPLPPEHAFWDMKNVLMSPHLGGYSDVYVRHALPFILENIRYFMTGDTGAMLNRVAR